MNGRAYYNEIDPYAAQWLRNLISAGHIAPGVVDERSIVDVRPDELAEFEQCHFFAGIGGWSYALRLAGWPDSRPVWTGSCPCQPFSLAGAQKGFDDERHLWPVWRELIAERRPAKVFGEQVASATEWLRLVRSDLEALGYAVGAMPIQAASAGADHIRDRFWFVADADFARSQGREILPERADQRTAGSDSVANANGICRQVDQDTGGRAEGSGARAVAGLGSTRDGNVADTDITGAGEGRQQRGWQFGGAGGDQEACAVGNAVRSTGERYTGSILGAEASVGSAREFDGCQLGRPADAGAPAFEWVIGADGKARRVKPGLRLLAHGVSNRVGKLRGFGNAIDPRPAAEFILAAQEAIGATS